MAKDNFALNEIIKRLRPRKERKEKALKMLSEIICVKPKVPT